MLAIGGAPPPPAPVSNVPKKPLNTFPFLSIQISKTYSFPVSTLSLRRSLCLFAQKKHGNGGPAVLDSRAESVEGDDVNDFDAEDNEFDEYNYGSGELDDDDDLDVVVPFEELDDWLQKKPRGFGEGKVYDTSIEDELLQEIENLRKAQQDDVSKLKSLSLEKTKQLQKDAEVASTGACVRISHLPKKRNIQRDLNAAFKGISGIVNIKPVVIGNKKTKDPICKGLAFVNFKSLDDAKRFMDIYSIRNIAFGKVEKRIKCEIVDTTNTALPKSLNNQNVGGENKSNIVENSGLSLLEDVDVEVEVDVSDDDESWDTDSGDEDDVSEESFKSLIASELEEINRAEKMKKTSAAVSQQSKTGEIAVKKKTSLVLQPSEPGDNPKAAVKVKSTHKKRETSKVAKIPVAAQRLRLKEKAMLADVYARYGSKVTSASKES